tara:strand:- start:90 stop:284 length:195 start_codon:yes stop_codon:yes gene_type:complete
MFSGDTKQNDGGQKVSKKKVAKIPQIYSLTFENLIQQEWKGGCINHPGCLWSTPCDCKNCTSFI